MTRTPNIVFGRFEQQAHADGALDALRKHGFGGDEITSFYANPPGQHAEFPIGGDRDASPGATSAGSGAITGAAVGSVVGAGIGLAIGPIAGPAAAVGAVGVGAYAGALAGAVGALGDKQAEPDGDARAAVRPAGIIVAALAPDVSNRIAATDILQSHGALEIEVADGRWADGKWTDFDPLSKPRAEGDEDPAAFHGDRKA